jgi:hypothetical protein
MTLAAPTHLRNADQVTLMRHLNDTATRAFDVVVPASQLRSTLGSFELSGLDPVVNGDGVIDPNGFARPTAIGLEGLAARLDIPGGYLAKCFTQETILFDHNVNTWLERLGNSDDPNAERRFLCRMMSTVDGNVLRAFMSQKYRTIDNFDVFLALAQGLRAAGVEPIIRGDVSERSMRVRVEMPGINLQAPDLLKNYRDPWTGASLLPAGWTPDAMRAHNEAISARTGKPMDSPTIYVALDVRNSETGGSALEVLPVVMVQICHNGLTMPAGKFRKTHVGARLDQGVQWNTAAVYHNRELVKAQITSMVENIASPEYLDACRIDLEKAAGVELGKPAEVVELVSRKLGFTQDEQDSILDFLIRGGQATSGGVMGAVTAFAQTVADPDRAYAIESVGVAAMHEACVAVKALR